MHRVDLVIMNGRSNGSDVERMVDNTRVAVTRDLIDYGRDCGAFGNIIVGTNDPDLAQSLMGLPSVIVERDPEGEAFHFGKRLQALIAKYKIERLLYFGGGSAPLISKAALCELAEKVRIADRLFIANNFYSVDFCGFAPASALLAFEPPTHDNGLGWLFSDKVGFKAVELPRTVESLFDVDTPTDLLALSLHPNVPPHTRACLASLRLDTRQAQAASAVFLDQASEVLISGRVSGSTISYLERETASRSRVYSEERGMRADGRLARGEVRSLLGMHLANVGVECFFAEVVPQLCQAAFLDDRVLWADRGIWPSVADRFHSDLLLTAAIAEPFVQRFTAAAASCPVPVVLGGHSLVTGGLRVFVESAWARSSKEVNRPVERTKV